MQSLREAYAQDGTGILYWCGFSDAEIPAPVASLIQHARDHGRQAYYVPALSFDDLLTRLALHCLDGERRKAASECLEEFIAQNLLVREPFQVHKFSPSTLIKSNAFPVECPSEVLQFDLKDWPPKGEVWSKIRETVGQRPLVTAPLKGKILALGTIDDIKEAFGNNIKGPIERTPVTPTELNYEDGTIVSLMREALVRSMSEAAGVRSDGRLELWQVSPQQRGREGNFEYEVFPSVQLFLRRIGGSQYLVLKPSLKVLDKSGAELPVEVANPIKLGILGYQHNKPFNQAVNNWRRLLFPKGQEPVFEFPRDCGSTFKFKVSRSPVFGEIGLPGGGATIATSAKLQPLLKHHGLQLPEPQLVFSNRGATGTVKSAHPIRGIVPEETAVLRKLGHRFFGVADSRQKIYKEQDSVAKLESETNTVNLRYHYRNGKKICTVADGLAKAPTGEPSLVETSKYDEPKAPSSVEVICRPSLSAQCLELLARLDTQLKAYPGELIGVACPRGEDLADVIIPLRSSPFSGLIVAQTSEEGYVPFEPAKDICVSKLHSAKGLEFRAFHILATEGLKKFPMQRELTFMGVTRAKTSLCIYHSGDLPGYLAGC
jgi:hypothetical protein